MSARSSSQLADAVERRREGPHGKRLALIFLVETAILEPVIYFLIWHHLAPGTMTDSARGAQFDMLVLVMIAGPIGVAVVTYFLYAAVTWRHPRALPLVDGPPIRSNLLVQSTWIALTSATVMGAFIFGTYELIVPAGAGGGEGPAPIWTPASQTILPIQVIGQQWMWTYRYPTFGGFETTQLVIPNNTEIAFHVTSLDVIHDWWAYQLGIKADANPQIDNVAFTKTNEAGRFTVRCDELCGIWHGAMYNYGTIVSPSAFESWAKSTESRLAPATKLLPKFSWTYNPSANGAGGSYYPSQDTFDPAFAYEKGSAGTEGKLPGLKEKTSDRPAKK